PELEHFELRVRAVRRAINAPGAGIDGDDAVQLADANRRFARDVPGVDRPRAVRVWQISALGTYRNLRDPGRSLGRRYRVVAVREVHGIGDSEEQRRGCVHADERRIAAAVEIANPHNEYIRS